MLALLAAAESAAFVGLALPGETAMLLGGFLAFQGYVSLGWMMAAGALGDSVGYRIRRAFGEPLKRSPLGRKVGEERWAKGEAYLCAKGGGAVFLGPPQLVSSPRPARLVGRGPDGAIRRPAAESAPTAVILGLRHRPRHTTGSRQGLGPASPSG